MSRHIVAVPPTAPAAPRSRSMSISSTVVHAGSHDRDGAKPAPGPWLGLDPLRPSVTMLVNEVEPAPSSWEQRRFDRPVG